MLCKTDSEKNDKRDLPSVVEGVVDGEQPEIYSQYEVQVNDE